jgi:hypothetical protein
VEPKSTFRKGGAKNLPLEKVDSNLISYQKIFEMKYIINKIIVRYLQFAFQTFHLKCYFYFEAFVEAFF